MSAPAELRGITWGHERGRDPLVATAERFEAETGIRVSWTARSLQAVRRHPESRPRREYDLLVLDHPAPRRGRPDRCAPPARRAARRGRSSPTRPGARSGRATRATSGTGHLWGLAIDAAGHVSAYRPDLLDRLEVAPPETWDDVFALDGSRPRRRDVDLASEQGGRHARLPAHAPRERGHRSLPGRGAASRRARSPSRSSTCSCG